MKKPTDNPADPFKKALAETTRVLADDPELAVSYSVDPPGQTEDTVRLPQRRPAHCRSGIRGRGHLRLRRTCLRG